MNPELRRLLWLELSPPRLLLTPFLIGLGFGALLWSGQPWALAIADYLSWWGFWVLALGWGSRRVAAALTDELAESTWHGQRMSSLGAWPMTWGKLAGGAAVAWYAAAFCLTIHLALRVLTLRDCPPAMQGGCDAARLALAAEALAMIGVALAG